MPKGKNTKGFKVYYDPFNWNRCQKRAANADMKVGTYIRHIAVNGKVMIFDLDKYKDMRNVLRSAAGYFNEIARAVNSTGNITQKDIELIKDFQQMIKSDFDYDFKEYDYELI